MLVVGALSFLALRRPLTPTLFPYTTLFRSIDPTLFRWDGVPLQITWHGFFTAVGTLIGIWLAAVKKPRSEEHTSELQSRFELVCRPLLDKTNPATQCKEADVFLRPPLVAFA